MYNEGVVDVPELDRLTGVFGLRAWVSIFSLKILLMMGGGGSGVPWQPLVFVGNNLYTTGRSSCMSEDCRFGQELAHALEVGFRVESLLGDVTGFLDGDAGEGGD